MNDENILNKSQTQKNAKTSFQCDHCDKQFHHFSRLMAHKKVHSHISNYTCDHCGKKYKYFRNLKKHLKTHIEPHVLKCEWCPSKFSQKTDLEKHTQNHTFYKCVQCNQTFVWKSRLLSHNCPFKVYNELKFFAAKRKYNNVVQRVWMCSFCDECYPNISDVYNHTVFTHLFQT